MEMSGIGNNLIREEEVYSILKKKGTAFRTFQHMEMMRKCEGKKYLKEITNLVCSVLKYAQIEAKEGNIELHWKSPLRESGSASEKLEYPNPFPNNMLKKELSPPCEIFQTIFFGLNLYAEMNECDFHLIWPENHYLLNPNPKPAFKANEISRYDYFCSILKEGLFSDFTLSVEGKLISTHRVILAQCPLFKSMLTGDWKESKEEVFSIEDYSHETFSKLLEHLYSGKIFDDTWIKDFSNCLDLFKLTDYLQYEPIKNICKSNIYDKIDKENFLQIAQVQKMISDPDIDNLCKWFLKENPNFGQDLDLSSLSILELATVYQINEEYKIEKLKKEILDVFKEKLNLDHDFIKLCKHIKHTQDNNLRNVVKDVIKNKKSLSENLKKDKDCYKAFKKMMVSLDF